MSKSKLTALAIVTLLIAGTFTATAASAPKPGAKCAKAGLIQKVAGKKYTCTKSGTKLTWSKGSVVEAKPSPTITSISDPNYSATFMQIRYMTILGNATPGSTLTLDGGEWIGPYSPSISYQWLGCSGGLPQDYRDGYADGPKFFKHEYLIDFESERLCKLSLDGAPDGNSIKLPDNLNRVTYVTVRQTVRTKNGLYSSYARGVRTSGLPPSMNARQIQIGTSIPCNNCSFEYPEALYVNFIPQPWDPNIGENGDRAEIEFHWYRCLEMGSWLDELPKNCLEVKPQMFKGRTSHIISSEDVGKFIRLCITATAQNLRQISECKPGYFIKGLPR